MIYCDSGTYWQIGAVDRQIDEAVYRLYGLTDEEIKMVEREE